MVGSAYSEIVSFLKKQFPFVLLCMASLGLAMVLRQPLRRLPTFVEWNTIVTLTGLLLVTTGIKESGLFYLVAYRISRRIGNERNLALFLIFVSAILSLFLTNDIALFIVVPLTVCLQNISESDYTRIIVFEAIAVNAGSSLTSIGNPQNIFLWHQWGVSFPVFIKETAPLVPIMSAWLFIMVLISFRPTVVKMANRNGTIVDRGLFYISSILLITFIIAVEFRYGVYFLAAIFIIILLYRRSIIARTDWGLILLFVVIFIDLNMVSHLEIMQHLFSKWNMGDDHTLFLSSAILSQVISNVPSAVLMANYSSNFKIIAYGVNIGGNGLIIGSFANLIAMRFITKRGKYLLFHAYSIPYFMITLASVYFFLIG